MRPDSRWRTLGRQRHLEIDGWGRCARDRSGLQGTASADDPSLRGAASIHPAKSVVESRLWGVEGVAVLTVSSESFGVEFRRGSLVARLGPWC
jgi:hypothetical protein